MRRAPALRRRGDGSYDIVGPDGAVLVRGAARSVSVEGAGGAGVRLRLDTERVRGALFLTVTATNATDRPLTLHTLGPLRAVAALGDGAILPTVAPDGGGWTAWIHGRMMTADALTHRFGSGDRHDTFSGRFVERDQTGVAWTSHALTVLTAADGRTSLLLGFVTLERQFSETRWRTDAAETRLESLDTVSLLEGHVLAAGASVRGATLMVACGDDPVALAERYADEAARRMQARPAATVPTGWCSWYYFYNQITDQNVRDNLATLQRLPYAVDYAQIDDGYQAATGDWLTPNERFPHGMQPLAAQIAAAGFRPGLWLAPFTLNRDARVLAERPEWALRDADGAVIFQDIWLGPCAGLDCTHPGAREWLRHLIRTIVHEWGYTFLKLDALFTACHPGARHHVPNTTAAANLRLGLETIREAAGDGAFILGCTCPFGPAVGLVDAMRVGPDVEARWFNGLLPSAKHAMRLSLQRTFLHRRWWLNDPDCLSLRDYEAPLASGTLTLEEARFLATGIALSGGLAVLSDDLTTLSEERRDVALRVLPPTGRAARPLDLLERETPSLWALPLGRGRLAVAALNWDDASRDMSVTWERLGISGPRFAREQWTDTDLGRLDGSLVLPAVPPHAARVVLLDPARPPRPTGRLLPVR
ncbi:MAG: alpha-galactosidase [Dehalococcoidia bacterium]